MRGLFKGFGLDVGEAVRNFPYPFDGLVLVLATVELQQPKFSVAGIQAEPGLICKMLVGADTTCQTPLPPRVRALSRSHRNRPRS